MYLNVTDRYSWRLSSAARGKCEHFIQNQDWVLTDCSRLRAMIAISAPLTMTSGAHSNYSRSKSAGAEAEKERPSNRLARPSKSLGYYSLRSCRPPQRTNLRCPVSWAWLHLSGQALWSTVISWPNTDRCNGLVWSAEVGLTKILRASMSAPAPSDTVTHSLPRKRYRCVCTCCMGLLSPACTIGTRQVIYPSLDPDLASGYPTRATNWQETNPVHRLLDVRFRSSNGKLFVNTKSLKAWLSWADWCVRPSPAPTTIGSGIQSILHTSSQLGFGRSGYALCAFSHL